MDDRETGKEFIKGFPTAMDLHQEMFELCDEAIKQQRQEILDNSLEMQLITKERYKVLSEELEEKHNEV